MVTGLEFILQLVYYVLCRFVSDECLLKEKHSGNAVWYQPPGINRELSHASFSFTGPIRRCHALPIFHSTAKNPHHLIYNAEFRRLFMHFDYFYLWSIRGYIITQVILAFWLVLAYDLLEDRRTIDVIFSKFFPLCFKMAESFENLENEKCRKNCTCCRGCEQVGEARRKKNTFVKVN